MWGETLGQPSSLLSEQLQVSWFLHLFLCPVYNPDTNPALGELCHDATPDLDLLSLVFACCMGVSD